MVSDKITSSTVKDRSHHHCLRPFCSFVSSHPPSIVSPNSEDRASQVPELAVLALETCSSKCNIDAQSSPQTISQLSTFQMHIPFFSSLSTRSRCKPFQVALPPARTSHYVNSFFPTPHCSGTASLMKCYRFRAHRHFKDRLEYYWAQYRFNPYTDRHFSSLIALFFSLFLICTFFFTAAACVWRTPPPTPCDQSNALLGNS